MIFNPHEYQTQAIDRIIENKKVGLFLDMGLGKTVCTLTAIRHLIYSAFEVSKVLVVAPLRVAKSVWPAELEKWDHLKPMAMSLVVGPAQKRKEALSQKADIYVVNRENIPWLTEYLKEWPFDMVVVDELSSFKSPKAKRFKELRKVRPKVDRVVGLTGTPAPNGLIDLWAQIYLLDMGERLGKTVTGYRERYFRPGWQSGHVVYRWDPKPEAEGRIYEKIGDLCVSMTAQDWLKLPDRVDLISEVEMSGAERKMYDQMKADYILPLVDGDVTADSAGVLSNKLLQMANGAVYDEHKDVRAIHERKLEALEDLIEAANGRPVLVFYQYKHDLDAIKRKFPEAEEVDVEKWNRGEIPIMLAHPASAGHGLNLQDGGNVAIWYGLTWNLEHYLQANARLHRQGQTKTVFIHHIITKGTIDEKVHKALKEKDASQAALIAAVKGEIL